MNPVEELQRAQAAQLVDEDGAAVELELAPGLAPAEIDALAAELGVPLPAELRALLARASGIAGALDTIDFTGRSLSFGGEDMFPSGLAFAGDGFGNHWVLDLTPDAADAAPVFYACHDAPVVLYQSPDLGHFVHELVRMYVPPHASLVDDVHEDRPFEVWRRNPGIVDHAAALEGDEALRAFASELGERYLYVDLRAPEVGMGFAWGRFGPRTEVRRAGYERLFAYAPPEKKPRLLRRLLP